MTSSCLENPRDGGPWWAAVSGVAESRTVALQGVFAPPPASDICLQQMSGAGNLVLIDVNKRGMYGCAYRTEKARG